MLAMNIEAAETIFRRQFMVEPLPGEPLSVRDAAACSQRELADVDDEMSREVCSDTRIGIPARNPHLPQCCTVQWLHLSRHDPDRSDFPCHRPNIGPASAAAWWRYGPVRRPRGREPERSRPEQSPIT